MDIPVVVPLYSHKSSDTYRDVRELPEKFGNFQVTSTTLKVVRKIFKEVQELRGKFDKFEGTSEI